MMPQRRKSDNERKNSAATREWPTVARQNEKRAALIEKTTRGVGIFDAEERLVDCNRIFISTHQLPKELSVKGAKYVDILNHHVDTGNFDGVDPQTYLATHFNMVQAKSVDTRLEHLPDGRVISVGHIPVESGGWMTTYDDVSALFAVKHELEHSAYYDRRTALPNGRLLLECIDEAFMESWDEDYFALLYIQLQDVEAIRARLGEDSMHTLKKQIAARLRNGVRSDDLPAKLEDTNFAILQQSVTSVNDSIGMAQRLITVLQMPYDVAGTMVLAEFSIGIALPLDVDENEHGLMVKAEQAAAKAAAQSGQRYSVHSSIPLDQKVA